VQQVFTLQYSVNRINDFLGLCIFGQKRRRSNSNCGKQPIVINMHREKYNRRRWSLAAQGRCNMNSGYSRQLHIHQNDGWLVNIRFVKSLMAVLCLSHDGKAGIRFKQSTKSDAIHRMVVNNHDPAFEHRGVSFVSGTCRPATRTAE
jgi:hypothetical protein